MTTSIKRVLILLCLLLSPLSFARETRENQNSPTKPSFETTQTNLTLKNESDSYQFGSGGGG